MTNEQLAVVASQVADALRDVGAMLNLAPSDLAAVVSLAHCNINFWAFGTAGSEQLRTVADAVERHLLAEQAFNC